jgi:hypothetical protein
MNLYLVSQTINNDYDTYDSMIVAAEDEHQARRTCPSGHYEWNNANDSWEFLYGDGTRRPDVRHDWVRPDQVTVELIGITIPEVTAGKILASFNAG